MCRGSSSAGDRAAAILCWANPDENWNEWTRAAVPRHEGRWLDVKVECVRSTVRFYIDGKLVLSRDNVPRQVGRIGFSASQGLVRYKGIHIEGTAAKLERPWRIVARPTRFGTFHELPPKYRHTNVSATLDLTEFHRLPNAKSAKAGTYWKPTDLAKYRSTSAKWSDDQRGPGL